MNMDNDRLFRQTYMHCQLANSMHNHMNEAATGRISNGRKEAVPGGTVWGKESFFYSNRRRHTWWNCDWSSDVCSSDLGGVAERCPGLVCSALQGRPQLLFAFDDLHSDAAAAAAGLDDHGEADLERGTARLVEVVDKIGRGRVGKGCWSGSCHDRSQ